MVGELSQNMIDVGAEIIKGLEAEKVQVNSASWVLTPENKEWKLIIHSPAVSKNGPRHVYKKIQDKLLRLKSEVYLADIVAKNDIVRSKNSSFHKKKTNSLRNKKTTIARTINGKKSTFDNFKNLSHLKDNRTKDRLKKTDGMIKTNSNVRKTKEDYREGIFVEDAFIYTIK